MHNKQKKVQGKKVDSHEKNQARKEVNNNGHSTQNARVKIEQTEQVVGLKETNIFAWKITPVGENVGKNNIY